MCVTARGAMFPGDPNASGRAGTLAAGPRARWRAGQLARRALARSQCAGAQPVRYLACMQRVR